MSELLTARRRLCREIASAIIAAMAYRDMSFDDIAVILNKRPEKLRKQMQRLIDGKQIPLRSVADFCCALGYRMDIRFVDSAPGQRMEPPE